MRPTTSVPSAHIDLGADLGTSRLVSNFRIERDVDSFNQVLAGRRFCPAGEVVALEVRRLWRTVRSQVKPTQMLGRTRSGVAARRSIVERPNGTALLSPCALAKMAAGPNAKELVVVAAQRMVRQATRGIA